MQTQRAHTTFFPLVPLAAWIALAWAAPAEAADWKITPGIAVRETFSDNANLAPEGAEQSDFITELAPTLAVRGHGSRVQVSADYTMRHFRYARTDRASSTHHLLRAAGSGELIEDLFFVDAGASSTVQPISPFGSQRIDRGDVTGNQADVRTFSLSPYLRHRIGRIATVETRYTRDAVHAGDGGLSDSTADHIHLGIESGDRSRVLQWKLALDGQKIDYETAADVDSKAASASLRYLLTPRFALTASGGYEDNNYPSIGPRPKGRSWSVGFGWTPSERTNLATSAGRRFFGNTYSLSVRHRTALVAWDLGYQEDVTTTRSQFLVPSAQSTVAFLDSLWASSIPDPLARNEVVQRFIRESDLPATLTVPVNSFSNRVFLDKSAYASVALKGVRNTVVARLSRSERQPLSAPAADFGIVAVGGALTGEATRQHGASILWTLNLTSRTALTAGASYNRARSLVSSREDENAGLRIGLSRQLTPKARASVELRRNDRRSTVALEGYRENAIAAMVQMSF